MKNYTNFLFIFFILSMSKVCQSQVHDDSLIEANPDKFAQFKGGTSDLYEHIKSHCYNDTLLYEGFNTTGKVFLKLTIDKNGKVIDASILKGLSDDLNKLSLKIAYSFPNWIPAKKNGVSVKSNYTFPITFSDDIISDVKLKKEKCSFNFSEIYSLYKFPNSRREKLIGYSFRLDDNQNYSKYFTCNTSVYEKIKSIEYINKNDKITSISFNKNGNETIYTVYDSLSFVNFSNEIKRKFKKVEVRNNIEWYSDGTDYVGIEKVLRKLTLYEKDNLVRNYIVDYNLGNKKSKTVDEYQNEVENMRKDFYWRSIFTKERTQ